MSNRKIKRKEQSSARKKKPGFNPRHNARKEIRISMGQLFAAIDKYEGQVKRIGERIETEREQIIARAGDKKDLALGALEKAYAVFLAVISKNKVRVEEIIVASDKEAREALELSASNDVRWDDIKVTMVGYEMAIGEFHGEMVLMLQDYAMTMTTIFTMYENYSVKLRDGESVDVPDFETEFKRLLADREAALAVPETAEEVAEEDDPVNSRESRAEDAFERASA